MTKIDLSRAEWRKSSYSGQSGNCVEVARNLPGLVAVRDSKSPDAPNLTLPHETWQAFSKLFAASAQTRDSSDPIVETERAATRLPLARRKRAVPRSVITCRSGKQVSVPAIIGLRERPAEFVPLPAVGRGNPHCHLHESGKAVWRGERTRTLPNRTSALMCLELALVRTW